MCISHASCHGNGRDAEGQGQEVGHWQPGLGFRGQGVKSNFHHHESCRFHAASMSLTCWPDLEAMICIRPQINMLHPAAAAPVICWCHWGRRGLPVCSCPTSTKLNTMQNSHVKTFSSMTPTTSSNLPHYFTCLHTLTTPELEVRGMQMKMMTYYPCCQA